MRKSFQVVYGIHLSQSGEIEGQELLHKDGIARKLQSVLRSLADEVTNRVANAVKIFNLCPS